MRGPVDSPITLTILRKGVPAPIQTKVVRDIIRINPVKYSAEDDVGWIKIKTFQSEHTYEYMKQAVDDLKKTIGPKLKGYVIDLRNNPGGLARSGHRRIRCFPRQGRHRSDQGPQREREQPRKRQAGRHHRRQAARRAHQWRVRFGVGDRRGRASGSQACGTLLARAPSAKGSVQTMIPLGANGGLRLTTARYYTPSGRSIQATGIGPDYIVEPELARTI